VVSIERVTKAFHPGEVNEVVALSDVSLDVASGQFVVILGGNGSGKSTLLDLLAGAFFPDAGRVVVAGLDVTRMKEHRRAALIGRVFQDPLMGTSAGLTVEENFSLAASRGAFRGLGLALGPKLRRDIRDRLALLDMGLENRMKEQVGLLSGGQRQALTLLMAVFRKPKALLLDEHTAALDPRVSRDIMDLTKTIAGSERLTTLMVTHNLSHALEINDRAVIMHRGRIVADFDSGSLAAMGLTDLMTLFLEMQKSEEARQPST
jgi:putative tryptophan/tyrosine transport system ATP-binding protein